MTWHVGGPYPEDQGSFESHSQRCSRSNILDLSRAVLLWGAPFGTWALFGTWMTWSLADVGRQRADVWPLSLLSCCGGDWDVFFVGKGLWRWLIYDWGGLAGRKLSQMRVVVQEKGFDIQYVCTCSLQNISGFSFESNDTIVTHLVCALNNSRPARLRCHFEVARRLQQQQQWGLWGLKVAGNWGSGQYADSRVLSYENLPFSNAWNWMRNSVIIIIQGKIILSKILRSMLVYAIYILLQVMLQVQALRISWNPMMPLSPRVDSQKALVPRKPSHLEQIPACQSLLYGKSLSPYFDEIDIVPLNQKYLSKSLLLIESWL